MGIMGPLQTLRTARYCRLGSCKFNSIKEQLEKVRQVVQSQVKDKVLHHTGHQMPHGYNKLAKASDYSDKGHGSKDKKLVNGGLPAL